MACKLNGCSLRQNISNHVFFISNTGWLKLIAVHIIHGHFITQSSKQGRIWKGYVYTLKNKSNPTTLVTLPPSLLMQMLFRWYTDSIENNNISMNINGDYLAD